MSRIRTIKPEFWAHVELSMLPATTHLLAAALLNYADDEGYFQAHPGLVKGGAVPLRADITIEDIPTMLRHLIEIGYIRLGTGKGAKRYGHIVNFQNHQKVSHAAESRIAKMEIHWDREPAPAEMLQLPSQVVETIESKRPVLLASPEILQKPSGDPPEILQKTSGVPLETLRPELNRIELNKTSSNAVPASDMPTALPALGEGEKSRWP